MGFLSRLFGLDRAAPDETRRKILKTAAISPLFIPVLSGKLEDLDQRRADHGKGDMLDFMKDVLTVTLLGDELHGGNHVRMAINGTWIIAPYQRQIYIQRSYVDMLLRTRRCEGVDDRPRYPLTIHHDPAGELAQVWLANVTGVGQITRPA